MEHGRKSEKKRFARMGKRIFKRKNGKK